MKQPARCAAIGLLLAVFGCTPANDSADSDAAQRELRVITSGGFAAAYDILEPLFEQETGIDLITEYGSSSGGAPDSIPVRLERGELFDVVILSRSSLDNLAAEGKVAADSRIDLVHSTIGMAVRSGAPHPDISTPDAFIETLLSAESIGYSASASGTYLSTDLFPRIGLWNQLESKSTRVLSERVGSVVARGDVAIGFQQVSEILPIEGADFVGEIPAEYQRITTFGAGITANAGNASDARRLVEYLTSSQAAPIIASTGLVPVAEGTSVATGDAEYPTRPVTFVVGFGVGGSADRMTRAMSSHIGDALGQPVQVINRRGAGTLLAANYVLDQPHDGYTVFASSFSPYLSNTILEGNADYTIEDFAYLNFQWFDEDLIAVNRNSEYTSLPQLLEDVRQNPKTVRAAVVSGSAGHLMAKLLLELSDIPQENLNLVTYNSGGPARAAVAGHVVDLIVISAEGTESIRDYIRPLALVSDQRNPQWDAPTLTEAMAATGFDIPILPGSIRGYATTAEFRRQYPERFTALATALREALDEQDLTELLDRASIGSRWVGPEDSDRIMRETFAIFENYSYLLNR